MFEWKTQGKQGDLLKVPGDGDLGKLFLSIIGDKHIKIIMTGKNGEIIRGIAFNSKGGILESYLSKSYKKNIDIAGKITLNEWHGEKKIEFLIQDIAVN